MPSPQCILDVWVVFWRWHRSKVASRQATRRTLKHHLQQLSLTLLSMMSLFRHRVATRKCTAPVCRLTCVRHRCTLADWVTLLPHLSRLVEGMSFKICAGNNLLITGPNGAGKSSIFRCLGQLWTVPKGTITKPAGGQDGLCGDVFYLPQKPYSVVGSLRDQVRAVLWRQAASTWAKEGIRLPPVGLLLCGS